MEIERKETKQKTVDRCNASSLTSNYRFPAGFSANEI